MSILIITNKFDLSTDEVVSHLLKMDALVFRLNTEDLCSAIDTELHITEGRFEATFNSLIRSVNLSEIRSIFYRRPKQAEAISARDETAKAFVKSETSTFLNWLWEALDCFWVSKPSHIRRAESKIDQLKVAPRFGFVIPKTLITNNPATVRKFYSECGGKIINKVLAKGMVEKEGRILGIYTRKVEPEHLDALDSVKLAPCVFQESIEKAFEVRITIVGKQVFATEIHSQNSQRTKDDWRRYDLENTPHKEHVLPSEVESACLSLVRYYSLAFAAIDMIVTPQEKYVFLEINPNGQWLWLEKLTSQPISKAIAQMLVRGAL